MAAPITFTLPQQLRTAAPQVFGPTTFPAGYVEAKLTINLPTADYENVGNSFDLLIEASKDSGATWHPIGGAHWSGGAHTVKGVVDPPLTLVVDGLDAYAGAQVRATMDTAQQMTWGATLTLT